MKTLIAIALILTISYASITDCEVEMNDMCMICKAGKSLKYDRKSCVTAAPAGCAMQQSDATKCWFCACGKAVNNAGTCVDNTVLFGCAEFDNATADATKCKRAFSIKGLFDFGLDSEKKIADNSLSTGVKGCSTYSTKIADTAWTCTACHMGQIKNDGKECFEGKLIQGCKDYSAKDTCKTCETGLTLASNVCGCASGKTIHKATSGALTCATAIANCVELSAADATKCGKCRYGFGLKNDKTCQDNTSKVANCATYQSDDTKCETCHAGFTKKTDGTACECLTANKQLPNKASNPTECFKYTTEITSCATLSADDICSSCTSKSLSNNKCVTTITGCGVYSSDGTKCVQADAANYGIKAVKSDGSGLGAAKDGCKIYASGDANCAECLPGWTLASNACTGGKANCSKYDNTKSTVTCLALANCAVPKADMSACLLCNDVFVLKNGATTCSAAPSSKANWATTNGSDALVLCRPGYTVKTDGSDCVAATSAALMGCKKTKSSDAACDGSDNTACVSTDWTWATDKCTFPDKLATAASVLTTTSSYACVSGAVVVGTACKCNVKPLNNAGTACSSNTIANCKKEAATANKCGDNDCVAGSTIDSNKACIVDAATLCTEINIATEECKACLAGYLMADTKKKCGPWKPMCTYLDATNLAKCKTCAFGLTADANGDCKPPAATPAAITGCKSGKQSGEICTECDTGKLPTADKKACPTSALTNCDNADSAGTKCTKCTGTTYGIWTDGKCMKNDDATNGTADCFEYEASKKCKKCHPGKALGTDKLCKALADCEELSVASTAATLLCKECIDGKALKNDYKGCEAPSFAGCKRNGSAASTCAACDDKQIASSDGKSCLYNVGDCAFSTGTGCLKIKADTTTPMNNFNPASAKCDACSTGNTLGSDGKCTVSSGGGGGGGSGGSGSGSSANILVASLMTVMFALLALF